MISKDFRKCRFNPLEEDFWVSATELHSMGGERLMKWVIMVYDPGSPLIKKHPDLGDRKLEAEVLSGHLSDNDHLEAEAVTSFLRLINKRRWASTMAIENALWEMIEMIQKPVEEVGAGQDKDKLAASNMKKTTAENIVALNCMLDQLYSEFDPQEEAAKADVPEDTNLTAEGYAKKLREKSRKSI